ncbi:MAG: glycosyltransferase family 9 protein, partial [Candidatus Sericytochromatia bacterium]|nr:glycosyltransferase family 9 protein [Candidatus Sericytochromatia bacterium]
LGQLLCAGLGLLLRAPRRERPPAGDPAVRRIALVKFWGMGSIVLLGPAIARLRARHPQARITLVTQRANQELVRLLGQVDDGLYLELGAGPGGFLRSLAQLVLAVRQARFDLWLDAEFLTRFSALLTAVSGARCRVGFHVAEVFRGGFHHVQAPFNPHWHIVENFAALADGDLVAPAPPPALPALFPAAEAQARLEAKLAARGVSAGRPVIVVNPNAGELALERRWPIARFAALVERLQSRVGLPIVLIGAPAERRYVAELKAQLTDPAAVCDLAGETTLDELVALFARAALVVSNDTGPLHLACAAGAPTVALFGPETPVLFGPRNPRQRTVYKRLACSPCLTVHNGRSVACPYAVTHCVADITMEDVLAAAESLLAEVAPSA